MAFATNALFWLSYICIESGYYSSTSQNKNSQMQDQLMEIQALGMVSLRRILDESEFVKMLIGIFKLSPNFYSYSISISKK